MPVIVNSPTRPGDYDGVVRRHQAWSEEQGKLQHALLLRRGQYHVDCANLDTAARRLHQVLSRTHTQAELTPRVQRFLNALNVTLGHAIEVGEEAITFRHELLSLARRLYAVHSNLTVTGSHTDREIQSLRKILREYFALRRIPNYRKA
ncbi:MAG: hypothetical protein HUU16_04840 [Candidatus Omnitrophica bacterium]|nr:hypothetical protein [Candidatus Omnitrophota bacterium]